ncbi:MAG: DUF452 family protein [Alphaproteobacteria bacterium]|nr:DUF452 family protein [Alphaproteobacteria bacterium]
MRYFYRNNDSNDLIVFFAGWGCDENQFTNLRDSKDVVILYDYQDMQLDFDFKKYDNIYVIAYSAGVFVASVFADRLPNIRQKVAVCGNPYLFDDKLGISEDTIQVFKGITLDNYLDFRRKYMVFSDEEYERYNKLQSLRTIESCENELTALQKMYAEHKTHINPMFDRAIVAENDLIFNVQAQRDFYKDKLQIIKNAKHHIFFRFGGFADMLKTGK